jgi:hypothetical protein
MAQLGFCLLPRPALIRAAERDELTPSLRAEAESEDAAALTLALDDLASRSWCHRMPPGSDRGYAFAVTA